MSAKTVHDALITLLNGDQNLSTEFGAEIKKGFGKNVNLTEVGKTLCVAFINEDDVQKKIARAPIGGMKIRVIYIFNIAVGFYEPDEEKAEDRKTTYPAMIKNALDKDLRIGNTCIGLTKYSDMSIFETPYAKGIYWGDMGIVCVRDEISGNR